MSGQNTIAKRLKEARLRAGLSQKLLGIKAGIDEFSASPRINQYERAKHTPDLSMIELLAVVLAVPTPYFYTKDDELAKMIRLFGKLEKPEQEKLILEIEQLISLK